MNDYIIILRGGCILVVITILLVFLSLLRPWLQSIKSGAPVSVHTIVAMYLRRSPVKLICEQRIRDLLASICHAMNWSKRA